jgi:hypothetical protein
LALSHFTEYLALDFGGDLVFYVFFNATEHEGLENGVETLELVHVEGTLVLGVGLDVFTEPLLELFVGVEELGHDEMQEGP